MTVKLDYNLINLGIATVALILSIYSTHKTSKLNKLQGEVMAIEKELSKLQLEREKNETTMALKADLSASVIKLGNSKERLKVFNKGKAIATNIRFEQIGDANVFLYTDGIFPLESLEPYQSVELVLAAHDGSASKIAVRLTWDDGSEKNCSKDMVVTR